MISVRTDAARAGPAFGYRPDLATFEDTQGSDEQVTAATIKIMARLAREDANDPRVTAAAAEAIAGLSPLASDEDKITAAYWYVKNRVVFVGDEQQIEQFDFFFPPDELLIRPSALLTMERPRDDCDGFSMLLASMLLALDIKPFFKTVAANRDAPGRYSHVYAVAVAGRRRIPLDASHGPRPGVEVRPTYKSRLWPIGKKPMIQNTASAERRPGMRGLGLPTSIPMSGFDWGGLTTNLTNIAGKILIPRYGTPGAGTQAQYDESGQLRQVSTYPGGGATLGGPFGGSTSTLLLIGGAVLAVVLIAGGRR